MKELIIKAGIKRYLKAFNSARIQLTKNGVSCNLSYITNNKLWLVYDSKARYKFDDFSSAWEVFKKAQSK